MRRPIIPYARITRLLALILFLILFLYVCWPYTTEPGTTLEDGWPSHYADDMARKEKGEAELFLIIDPLVAISTAIAARTWVWSLTFAGIILGTGLLIPRGFCG